MIASLFMAAIAGTAPACRPPTVMLADNDKAFTARFWYQTPSRTSVEDHVRAAFKSACKSGLLSGATIPQLDGVSFRRLYLENQPNANGAMLEADQRADGSRRLILAYPYVAADR